MVAVAQQKVATKLIAGFLAIFVTPTVGFGNVVGVDTQNFNPTTNGLDFVTVQSSETLAPGVINTGLFVNHAVNMLPVFETDGHHQDAVTGADINAGLGLMNNWDLGISLPQIIKQEVDSDEERTQFDKTGNTEWRFNTKLRLWGRRTYGVAVVGSASVSRIANNPYTGENAGPTTALELVADTTIRRVALAVNAGYRWRRPGAPIPGYPVEPFHNQWIYSAAASYLFDAIDTKLIAEIFGSRPAKSEAGVPDKSLSSQEALLGLKFDVTRNVALHVGGGTATLSGVTSPDWRAYGGINVAIGPVFNRPLAIKVRRQETEAEKPPKPTPNSTETIVIQDVLFAFDSAHDVLPGAKAILKELIEYARQAPRFKRLIVIGHTDSVGSDAYNLELSVRRAGAIREYLIRAFRVDPSTIEAVGFGESRPISDNGNYQGRQQNRRVEIEIIR